ncbi:MAG: 2-amino-4-hydroxy-6-hydroxymethyldihydropteridine diphosphokinase [Xanthomonadales bacterium]|nr:2-amino-4-hydroxy-6-hydroxymethyldihydropteridine diphosphokinase [Gammaproteobacteria bacterium]NNK03896.1 2-amino-4-hydroxy-6-hydroxymethyldihydropteridine diphosphokinase [Xanthomonadales bacterium]
MSTAWLGLGSNVNADSNIRAGIRGLEEEFENVSLSPAYASTAVGFEGDDFINLVARVETTLHPLELRDFLRDLEDRYGRKRDVPKFSDRSLDIDILLYDDLVVLSPLLEIPRAEILKFSHVLKPLADLDPDLVHPGELLTMAEIWKNSGLKDDYLRLLPEFRAEAL